MTVLVRLILVLLFLALATLKAPPTLKESLEATLNRDIEFEGLSFVLLDFVLRGTVALILRLFEVGKASLHMTLLVCGLMWRNWYKPQNWVSGLRILFARKNHLVETAGIYFSISNLFYLFLILRLDRVLIALGRSIMTLSLDPLLGLVGNHLPLWRVLSFIFGLAGVTLFFYHTCFIDIFYGRFHDPVVKKINLSTALPNRGYDVFGSREFHCFEQEERLSRSGHITFGGPKAAMFSFAMAVLSGRLADKVRSRLLPAAFFEYVTNHSPALRDVGYAVRSVLDPVLNPVGFSNLLALVAAGLVTLSEAIAAVSLSGDAHRIHQAAFAAGVLMIVKKMGWIVATVHGRVSLVFRAKSIRSLFVQEPTPPGWQQQVMSQVQDLTQSWPWFGTVLHRLGRDIWNGMGNLYALLGWFSLVVIGGEYVVGAWEQVREPLSADLLNHYQIFGLGVAPLVAAIAYTLLYNPEAMFRIGIALFDIPAFWLYTKLSDHDVALPADSVTDGDATIDHIDWLLQPQWQWFWDELLGECSTQAQKYQRLQAVITTPDWLEQVCQHFNIQPAGAWQRSIVRFVFRPIEPKGWFSVLKSTEQRPYTDKAQQVISGYLDQLKAMEGDTGLKALPSPAAE